MPANRHRFMSWRDLVLTPLAQACTLAAALGMTRLAHPLWRGQIFLDLVAFYLSLVVVTLLFLWALRKAFPIPPGVYSYRLHPRHCYVWTLHGYLCITNLILLYLNPLIPPAPSLLFPFSRKQLYSALGAKLGRGILNIAGHISDPWLVKVDRNAIVGEGALLLPHLISRGREDILLLNRITIEEDSIIGARSVLLPGVKVGRGATIQAMSVVPMNTRIGAGELWGGNPARKLAEARCAAIAA